MKRHINAIYEMLKYTDKNIILTNYSEKVSHKTEKTVIWGIWRIFSLISIPRKNLNPQNFKIRHFKE